MLFLSFLLIFHLFKIGCFSIEHIAYFTDKMIDFLLIKWLIIRKGLKVFKKHKMAPLFPFIY